MNLYLLKRDHHEGQTVYGVFDSKEKALQQISSLKKMMPRVPEGEYIIKEIYMNELTEIEAHE